MPVLLSVAALCRGKHGGLPSRWAGKGACRYHCEERIDDAHRLVSIVMDEQ